MKDAVKNVYEWGIATKAEAVCAGGMPDGDYFLGELPVVVAGGTARL